MKLIKPVLLTATAALILSGCGSSAPAITAVPETSVAASLVRKSDLNDVQVKKWSHMDLVKDTVPGMSVETAYTQILNNRQGSTVIVGVIDSGVDINHEDLKDVIWTNEKEIAGNGIDDDKNGFIDDIHGWNFLGDANEENLEFVRLLKKGDDGSEVYKKAKAEYDKKFQTATSNKERYEQIYQGLTEADKTISEYLGKDTYTMEDVKNIQSDDAGISRAAMIMTQMLNMDPQVSEVKKNIQGGIDYFTSQLKYHLNKDFDGRSVVGDNPNDITDTGYGNNDVVGNVEHAKHGTHVAGIIAATRNNGIGFDGVAKNVKIMAVRTVPDGDEYDKDVALAIRYAVDNGAKVINGSFGKAYSPHPEWVRDAIKYAASKDVLIVMAAGNEGFNVDNPENQKYPNDQLATGAEIADNFLTVGALAPSYGLKMVAGYSNYGKSSVDVFAPGSKIWSTVPESKYEFLQGTSMAAPGVAGVAALIRSYYPKLSAKQVKLIIMKSGLTTSDEVILGGDPSKKDKFSNVSKSGNMVNLYNAIIMADQVSRGKVKL